MTRQVSRRRRKRCVRLYLLLAGDERQKQQKHALVCAHVAAAGRTAARVSALVQRRTRIPAAAGNRRVARINGRAERQERMGRRPAAVLGQRGQQGGLSENVSGRITVDRAARRVIYQVVTL